jgi:F-type H+-transporting ATPase subunit delta
MIVHDIARRYARALFDLSFPKELMIKRAELLDDLAQLLKKVPRMGPFFMNPQVKEEQKKSLLKTALPHLDPLLLHFLLLLVDKKRFKYLPEIAEKMKRMTADYQELIEVEVITAFPLEESIKLALEKQVAHEYRKPCLIRESLDAKLIGGAILIVGNQMIDFSLKGRLNKLKIRLLSSKYEFKT